MIWLGVWDQLYLGTSWECPNCNCEMEADEDPPNFYSMLCGSCKEEVK